MGKGFFDLPEAVNESVKGYAQGSKEREDLISALKVAKSTQVDIPQYIGNKQVFSGNKVRIAPPHDHQHILGYFHEGNAENVEQAIDEALKIKPVWNQLKWEDRAAIFLKAADLIAGPYRARINAATMLGQSKNVYQAEIDSACELIDFLRFNVAFMAELYQQQPVSSQGCWNRLEYRPLEGFVLAVTPFNFTAIAANLPMAPALMGNVVVWKPAYTQLYAANVIMEIFREAGLPDGVINMIIADGELVGKIAFSHKDFSGIHFTGSTAVFHTMWATIGANIDIYKSYPRIVGETGGKDFVFAHSTANIKALSTALIRGAFEYQGQKCSAASRAYIPISIWDQVKKELLNDIKTIEVGDVEDFSHFMNAVIDEKAFNRIVGYIDKAKKDSDSVEIISGGTYNKSKGYFIDPCVIVTSDPDYITMKEEIFGPVLSIYVYEDNKIEEVLDKVNTTSVYALTGAIFANDRSVISYLTERLSDAAGNFYINDKPTGAVVGQQPFGGARQSGTNDKAGSMLNLLRWVSPRTIKETFVSPEIYTYLFQK